MQSIGVPSCGYEGLVRQMTEERVDVLLQALKLQMQLRCCGWTICT